jgi:hypothetical protein
MRPKVHLMTALAGFLILLLSIHGADGAEEGFTNVDIEKYIEFRLEFDHGDKLHIEAEIIASPYPITIILMKGEEAYQDWTESEDVDIQAILDGDNVSNMNIAFEVIENFSQQNTTNFQEEIDIGEKDTYFLIIALHRESSMSTEDVMSRASQVQYRVDWKIEEKDVPYELLALAAFFFLAGVGFLVAYYISRKKHLESMEMEEEEARPPMERPPRPPMERRHAPPMR